MRRWPRPSITFRVALLEHLDDEEQHVLPIAARCITQEEWDSLGEHGTEKMSKAQLPLMFGALLEEAQPAERKRMLALVPLPVRVLLRTVFGLAVPSATSPGCGPLDPAGQVCHLSRW